MPSHAQLICSAVSFSYGPRPILRDISLTVAPGDRIGVVGPNGTGKTTLLRILAGDLAADAGTVATVPDRATVGLLSQESADLPYETVRDFLTRVSGVGAVTDAFDRAVQELGQDVEGAADRYDLALERYLRVDAATFDERMEQTLTTVGLAGHGRGRPVTALSGGQQTKLNLGATLLASFDVLLLDEPTNNLDVGGLEMLEDMMVNDQRSVVLVSHDRAVLERVTTSIYELDDHTHSGARFNGGFLAWQAEREVLRQQHHDAFAEYKAKRDRLKQRAQRQQQWSVTGVRRAKNDPSEKDKNIKAFRIAKSEKVASKARQTEQAIERLERTEKIDAPWQPWELRLEFAEADRSGSEVASLQQATVQRGDFTLGPIDALVSAGDRIMITGDNGSGKTTLLGALLGDIPLSTGSRRVGPSVQVARLEQGRSLFVDAPSLLRGFIDATGHDDQVARSQLAKLGLGVDRLERHVHELSPGERTRAALGFFAATGSNLLVLDEPTNHLDLPALEQLEAALRVFPHTVLLVTHDRRLKENVITNRHWHLHKGRISEQ